MINKSHNFWEMAARQFNSLLGSTAAITCACLLLLAWAWARLADSKWHELIVEGAAMLGFFNLFTLQRAQRKELKAIHIKLDELIACTDEASNFLIKAEEAPEKLLDEVHEIYHDAARALKDDPDRATKSLQQADDVLKGMHDDRPFRK